MSQASPGATNALLDFSVAQGVLEDIFSANSPATRLRAPPAG